MTMNRRNYLSTVGTTVGLGGSVNLRQAFLSNGSPSINITETNAPLEGGDLLEVIATVENQDNSRHTFDTRLFIDEEKAVNETVSIDPDETEEIEFEYRTYPVIADIDITVRVDADGFADQELIELSAVEELHDEDVKPDLDLTVQPGAKMVFEVDETLTDDPDYGNTHWFINGEYTHQSTEPWFHERQTERYEYWPHTFQSKGVYDIAAAVDNDEQNYTYQWVISVDEDGIEPPTIENIGSETIGDDSGSSYDVEIEVSSPSEDIDRIIWWDEDGSSIEAVTEISGSEDTVARSIPGGFAPTIWAITENNVVTEANPWRVETTEDERDEPSEERPVEELRSVTEFRWRLEREGIIVTYLQMVIDQINLDYQTRATTQDEKYLEIGIVASAYVDLVASGHESQLLHVIFVDNYGFDLGGYFIMSEWAQAYADGHITGQEFSDLILSTFGYE
ncbi:hypothetical protein [Natronosalvus vescus]|uniref:hypothetical protein n=1 Tax=Natronosalvus vescus TaxID=2953881 RepID=UPI002090362D|nr:hypothetical protein [Natronosalvus vescus]